MDQLERYAVLMELAKAVAFDLSNQLMTSISVGDFTIVDFWPSYAGFRVVVESPLFCGETAVSVKLPRSTVDYIWNMVN